MFKMHFESIYLNEVYTVHYFVFVISDNRTRWDTFKKYEVTVS